MQPCFEYCCHVWTGAPNCYLEMLDKVLKRICRTVGPSLATSLEPLPHRRNVASLSLFFRYYFGRCSSELAGLVTLSHSRGRFTRYSNRLHDFPVTIPRCYKNVYTKFLSSQSYTLEFFACIMLSSDLRSELKDTFIFSASFKQIFNILLSFFSSFSCTPCLAMVA